MTEQKFNDLLARWIDGDISPDDARTLEAALSEDPARSDRMREELRFADLLEQQLCPGRSFDAFVSGLETRLEAAPTGDAFVRELIPKLRQVDRREAVAAKSAAKARRVVRRQPAPVWRWNWGWTWAAAGGGLAAAAAVIWLLAVGGAHLPGGRNPVASITGMEGVVWQTEEQPIEWKVGDQLKAGEGVRLLSGKARFRTSNGNTLTLEGPADLRFLSGSEGILRQGAVLADGQAGGEPFRVRGLGAEIVVEPGATGVRVLEGERVENRTQLADGTPAATGAAESAPASARDSTAGATPKAEGALPHYQIEGEGAPVLLVLEDDDLQTREPIRVDVVPGSRPTETLASHDNPDKRPAIESVSRVRSYLVQVGNAGKGSAPESDYVDATVRFDRPILGISTMEDTLEKGDELTGYDPQQRLGAASEWKRGLKPPNDFVHIREDGKTLDLRVRKRDGERVPQLRVFVEGE